MILIKNGTVIDGVETPAHHADILISGDTISAIGHFSNKKTETVIDGLGMQVMPGFIATHTDIDHTLSLITNPQQEEYRARGITTIIGGHDGASLAPLIRGSLRSIQKWTDTDAIHINWHSVAEFINAINKLPLGVNFATLAGYTTIRRDITDDARTDLTDQELQTTIHATQQAIQEGALGASLHLSTAHGRGIPHHELAAVATAVAKAHGIITLHLRAHDEHRVEAITEALSLYKSTGATIVINDFLPRLINAAREKEILLAHEIICAAGDGFYIEISFAKTTPTPLYALLPLAAQKGDLHAMHEYVQNPAHQQYIMKELPSARGARIIHAPREYASLIGKTIEEFSRNHNCSLKEGVLKLMDITRLRAVLALPNAISPLHVQLMNNSQTLISGPPRAIFHAADENHWPIEKTVAAITSIPARVFNLKKRGRIHENYYADLILMNNRHEVTHTIVNGRLETAAGRFISARHP